MDLLKGDAGLNFQNNGFMKSISERILIYDGSKGFMLQQMGMKGGECPELWNVTHPEKVMEIYRMYKDAGADVIQTNTFQGSRVQLEKYSLGEKTYELNYEGARLARQVMGKDGFVAGSVGPLGKLFEPSGELTFDDAYEAFALQVKALADGGVDVINLETFTDIAEIRAALIASIETAGLPVICSMAFEQNGRTLMGTDPFNAAVTLKSLGASMAGTNCSCGPEQQLDILKEMSRVGGIYLSVKPNAGLPEMVDGRTVYRETPERFAEISLEYVKYGAKLIGGCCGTTPEHIKAISAALKGLEPTGRVVARNIGRKAHENPVKAKAITGDAATGNASTGNVASKPMAVGNMGNMANENAIAGDAATGNAEAIRASTDYIITSPFRVCDISPGNRLKITSLTDAVPAGRIADALGKPDEIVDIVLDVSSEDMDVLYIDTDVFPGALQPEIPGMVNLVQGYIRVPVIFKSCRPEILGKTLRIYRGRAGVVFEDYKADIAAEGYKADIAAEVYKSGIAAEAYKAGIAAGGYKAGDVIEGCKEDAPEELLRIAGKYGAVIIKRNMAP
jgi:methionine synthase I (cobalamin-dependent)